MKNSNLLPALAEANNQGRMLHFNDVEMFESAIPGGGVYTGFNDEFLAFGGVGAAHPLNLSKGSQMKTKNAMTISIINTNNTDVMVMLYGGSNPDSVNLAQTGVTLAKGGETITIATSPRTLKALQAFINDNPINFLGAKIDSDNVTAKNGAFFFKLFNLFKPTDDIVDVQFADWITGDQLNQLSIHVGAEQEISKMMQWDVLIPANSRVNLRCFFGASLSLHHALVSKNRKAAANRQLGGQQ
jgi:hypothetical protein